MKYGIWTRYLFIFLYHLVHQERMKDLMKHIKMLKNKMEMFIYFLQK